MTNRTLRRVLASAWLILSFTALAACASGAPVGSGELAGSASSGFAGYSWQVVSVSRHGKVTAIPPRYAVTMQFSPAGQFVASDGVNAYSGTYRAARGAFITSDVRSADSDSYFVDTFDRWSRLCFVGDRNNLQCCFVYGLDHGYRHRGEEWHSASRCR